MNHAFDINVLKEKLMESGIPKDRAYEIAKKVSNTPLPTVKAKATGGEGGKAINLTYMDNYSTLMLVYTFLLNYLDDDSKDTTLNKTLLDTFQKLISEQKQYRNAFLDAVNKLSNDK
ncbi:hypothetical protein [Heyndrickxia camelliae]|uniref:Uncharacterized protein n=1 Tax=Heyndrickxia camelliae TaxID=1707093 RepID=A0A2N3LQ43_9BACI|nr:hypothetical protein [Heyndrickxia camelliae]PKR86792.1 hypothetical protein CWO92_01650 [Heyndrickxia camelliae]